MTELGQLDARHEQFKDRNVRVVVVSLEGAELSRQTQEDFPNLLVASDPDRRLSEQLAVIHEGSNPFDGGDTTAPTTLMIDRQGVVRWTFRPDRYIERLPADELLAKIDEHLASG